MQPRGVMVAQVILVHFVEVRILTGLPFFFAVMGGKRRALLLRRSVTDHAVRSLSCSFVKPGVSSPIIGKNEFPCAWRPKKAKHIPPGWQSTLRNAQGAGNAGIGLIGLIGPIGLMALGCVCAMCSGNSKAQGAEVGAVGWQSTLRKADTAGKECRTGRTCRTCRTMGTGLCGGCALRKFQSAGLATA